MFGLGKDKTAFNKAVTDDQLELLKDQEVSVCNTHGSFGFGFDFSVVVR